MLSIDFHTTTVVIDREKKQLFIHLFHIELSSREGPFIPDNHGLKWSNTIIHVDRGFVLKVVVLGHEGPKRVPVRSLS